jgi:hypothetical protein
MSSLGQSRRLYDVRVTSAFSPIAAVQPSNPKLRVMRPRLEGPVPNTTPARPFGSQRPSRFSTRLRALPTFLTVDLAGHELPLSIEAFVDSHLGPDRQLTLRLA